MLTRWFAIALALSSAAVVAAAQSTVTERGSAQWRTSSAGESTGESLKTTHEAAPARAPKVRITERQVDLPGEKGQVWRDYDISPYTVRVTATKRPEQAIVDWILRETGYEAWHSEPIGLLSANRRTLSVYHTPAMHDLVEGVVERFLSTEAETHAFGVRIVSLDHPNWRVKAQTMLRPLPVQTQGIQAWLLRKEDAALLLAELRRRSDYREHGTPHLLVNSGQSTVVSNVRPRSYVQDIVLRPNLWPAFEAVPGRFDEGFALELSPLLSLDGRTIDAVIKCNIDQVERLVPVMLDVPTPVAPNQRTKVEVPQMAHCRVHERFRWPTEDILLVGLGVVATPLPPDPTVVRLPLVSPATRADLLVFVESKGRITPAAEPETPAVREAKTSRGRY